MGLKLVDSVDIEGHFITHPNTILTFQRDFWTEKTIVDENGQATAYRLHATMRLYTLEAYAKIDKVGVPDSVLLANPPIFKEEQIYEITPDILNTNISAYLYSKMLELYPTAVPC